MVKDDYDGQMIFGDHVDLKLPDIRLTGDEKPRKNLNQETCPDRESNPGPLRGKRGFDDIKQMMTRWLRNQISVLGKLNTNESWHSVIKHI